MKSLSFGMCYLQFVQPSGETLFQICCKMWCVCVCDSCDISGCGQTERVLYNFGDIFSQCLLEHLAFLFLQSEASVLAAAAAHFVWFFDVLP